MLPPFPLHLFANGAAGAKGQLPDGAELLPYHRPAFVLIGYWYGVAEPSCSGRMTMCNRVVFSEYSLEGKLLPNLFIVLVRHGGFEFKY